MASTRSSANLARYSALGGILYVVLFIIGTILLFSGEPDSDAAPAKVIAWYSDSGHRDRIGIGWVVAGLGIFFFLWFLSSLRRTVRRLEGEDGFLTALTTIGGSVYATLAFAAIAVNMGIRTMSDDTYRHTVYSGVIHAASDASYLLVVTGGAAMAALIFATSIAARRYAILPRWVSWFGFVAGVAAIVSIAFFTMLFWLLWVAVASVSLFLASRRPAAATRREPSAATS
jgi:hypothetical protein